MRENSLGGSSPLLFLSSSRSVIIFLYRKCAKKISQPSGIATISGSMKDDIFCAFVSVDCCTVLRLAVGVLCHIAKFIQYDFLY